MRKCRKSLSHRCNPCSHRCKPLSHQCKRLFLHFRTGAPNHLSHSPLTTLVGCTPKGAYPTRGRSRHLLETPFSEPLLRTLLRTLFYCKTHRRPPSQNPSENPFHRTLPRTFSEPFSERCVAVRPLRRAPKFRHLSFPLPPFFLSETIAKVQQLVSWPTWEVLSCEPLACTPQIFGHFVDRCSYRCMQAKPICTCLGQFGRFDSSPCPPGSQFKRD